ncbi:MAG TPA: response regulator transcription factor [Anaerolineaceae bacterium]|nr:response regulator transcription factor [Anaerolineaceae bacterium]
MKILIIDDDPSVTDLLELILTPTQAEIQHAYDGEQGAGMLREFVPDIILLDYMMPGMDGMETTRRIRKVTKTPIIILSVLNDPIKLARVLDAGADDYLIKPVSRGVLIAHINNLLRRCDETNHERPPLQVSLQSA